MIIFGILKNIVKLIADGITKLLLALNLQITFLCLVVGLLLRLFGAMPDGSTMLTVFQVLLVLSLAYAIVMTLFKLFFPKRAKEREPKTKGKSAQMQPDNQMNYYPQQNGYVYQAPMQPNGYVPQIPMQQTPPPMVQQPQPQPMPERPIYYRVRQNPQYVMAEYSNRYELYVQQNNGLVYVRTDYKTQNQQF